MASGVLYQNCRFPPLLPSPLRASVQFLVSEFRIPIYSGGESMSAAILTMFGKEDARL